MTIRRWTSPGPIAWRFMQSRKRVRCINGPVGSGKTSCCLVKGTQLATVQPVSPIDGYRHFKLTIVRDTYRQLWRTTIESWWKWVPKEIGTWTGGKNEPATHEFEIPLADGTRAKCIYEFMAIGDNDIEETMRGYEPTCWYLNEADILAEKCFEMAVTRRGRYPKIEHGEPIEACVLIDCNAPDVDTWLYERGVLNRPESWDYFRQPGAFEPGAENLDNLPSDYYQAQIEEIKDKALIDKMVHNKSGYSKDGKAVYGEEYVDDYHVSPRDLEPVPGVPLTIGLDAGGTPAAVILQKLPNSQWRALDELVVLDDAVMGARRFGETLRTLLRDDYEGYRVTGWGDPSAEYGADKEDGELNWLQKVEAATKIRIRAAPSNNLSDRLEAVRAVLESRVGGEPRLLISPRCQHLRKGFAAKYQYKKMKVAGERYADKPSKNDASHVHDALQYAILGGGETGELKRRERQNSGGRHQVAAADEENPRGGFDYVDDDEDGGYQSEAWG